MKRFILNFIFKFYPPYVPVYFTVCYFFMTQ